MSKRSDDEQTRPTDKARNASEAIERMSERKVFLELRVKVRKNWRNDEQVLRGFGYHTKSK